VFIAETQEMVSVSQKLTSIFAALNYLGNTPSLFISMI